MNCLVQGVLRNNMEPAFRGLWQAPAAMMSGALLGQLLLLLLPLGPRVVLAAKLL
jgi:hypothetical protein